MQVPYEYILAFYLPYGSLLWYQVLKHSDVLSKIYR
jgi:hypothetical protein